MDLLFGRKKRWTILRFERQHYEKYIKETSRNDYLINLEKLKYSSLQQLIERKTTNFNSSVKDSNLFSLYNHQLMKSDRTASRRERDRNFQELIKIDNYLKKSNLRKKYVFCLTKYYEGDIYVLQRLLSWGKQVKVIFPLELKNWLAEEINATWKLYR